MKQLFKFLLLLIFFGIAQNMYAQVGGVPANTIFSECTIDSIYFETIETTLSPESLVKLYITPGHPDCGEKQLPFKILLEEYENNGLDDDVFGPEQYYFGSENQPIIITFKPGNEYCDNEACKYYITFTSEGWIPTTNLSTNPDDISSFFDTDAKIAAAQLDVPCGNCNENIDFDFIGIENNGEGLAQTSSTNAQNCEVIDVTFNPHGTQDESTTPFLNPGQQTEVRLNIKTSGCNPGTKFFTEIWDTGGTFNEEAEEAQYEGFLPIGETEIKNVYIPGNTDCDGTINGSPACSYGVNVEISFNNGPKIEKYDVNDATSVEEKIEFRCGTTGCDEIEWQKITSNLVDSSGNSVVPQQSTTEPVYDQDSPCYDQNLNSGDGGYNPNCYEFLAPIPGLGEEFGNSGRYAIQDLSSFTLGEYINTMFQIALGILMVLAVIMIVIAGVEYMTSEAIYSKGAAKKRIVGAITGLVLALSIFLILNTINPELLKINFGENIDSVTITVEDPAAIDGDGTSIVVTNAPATQICNNRKDRGYWKGQTQYKLTQIAETGNNLTLGSLEANGVNFKANVNSPQGTNITKKVEEGFSNRVKNMISSLNNQNISTRITEAFGPSSLSHGSPCHYLGSCIDLATGTSAGNASYSINDVEKIIRAADAAGLTAQFEFSNAQSQQAYKAMQDELATRGIDKCMIKYVTHASNWHFSVYDKVTPGLTL